MTKSKRIVILDGYATNPGDLNWENVAACGELSVYDNSTPEEIVLRSINAAYIVTNKVEITSSIIDQLPNLECICVSATGYNNVDINYARKRDIDVCNVTGYSTPSVAQHVFALLLALTNHVKEHSDGVHDGEWTKADVWCYWTSPLMELASLTMGIYGYGKIGEQVAEIALSFGMKVIASRRSDQEPNNPAVTLVSDKELLSQSDVLSLHAPLTDANRGYINRSSLQLMKPNSILINTGRGGLIHEADLAEALKGGVISAAALDVLNSEPPDANNPLYGIPNCIITPHIAWATKESRQRLVASVAENIMAHQKGEPQNVVN